MTNKENKEVVTDVKLVFRKKLMSENTGDDLSTISFGKTITSEKSEFEKIPKIESIPNVTQASKEN